MAVCIRECLQYLLPVYSFRFIAMAKLLYGCCTGVWLLAEPFPSEYFAYVLKASYQPQHAQEMRKLDMHSHEGITLTVPSKINAMLIVYA